ncbi:MAG: hypothetical protein LBT16_00170 [Treponema sp.]|jgi:hypothetical protein|nr:hypothetical protein [Treponema sp.]
MNKNTCFSILLYAFFLISGSLYGLGEKTLILGGGAGWETVETRRNVGELPGTRPLPVMALSSAAGPRGPENSSGYAGGIPDLSLSFDEGRPDRFVDRAGHYAVTAGGAVTAVAQRRARSGAGAAGFNGGAGGDIFTVSVQEDPLVITPLTPEALLSGDRRFGDFTLEFWLNPFNMENGEQILSWSSTKRYLGEPRINEEKIQRIQCAVSRNRLQWNFQDFFTDPEAHRRLSFSFTSISSVTPQVWSHHLIRFDSQTGLLEYLVNGRAENILYTTVTGREGAEVYTPLVGQGSRLILGRRYTGLMDEFRFYGSFLGEPALQRYPRSGGRMETRFLDLGEGNSEVLRVDARGGRISYSPGTGLQKRERVIPGGGFAGGREFDFPDDGAIRLFIRTSETPYPDRNFPWRPFESGAELKNLRGRYVQLAAEFYPSGDGETTPYLDELSITYIPDGPPRPPSVITAIPLDGAVELSWNNSADRDTSGYLIYYGTSRGDFFGNDAILGVSPIDVGKRNSVRIEGLSNGVLYYFAVSAYDRLNPPHGGEFSREVPARPLRMVE